MPTMKISTRKKINNAGLLTQTVGFCNLFLHEGKILLRVVPGYATQPTIKFVYRELILAPINFEPRH